MITQGLTAAQETFLAHFEGLKREGDHWKALCPGHDDHNQSLSIKFDGSRALVHDFAGCGTEYLLERVGLKLANLFFDAPKDSCGNHGGHATSKPIAAYPYVDEAGKLLFEVLRFEPKEFRQRKPRADGSWSWRLNGVRGVPYQLPQLLVASEVLIVEGEKDCNNAQRLGFVATCNPGGAGKWREEFGEYFRGKRVAVISDADSPGRKHAQQVAASLNGKADSVKVLELPAAKDLSEWIERDGTRDGLLNLIGATAEWAPGDVAKNRSAEHPPIAVPKDCWPDPLAGEAFHGLAGEFILAAAPHTEADPAALLIQFLVCIGSVIGRGPYFMVEQHRHHVNLFALIVGETSKARKGSSLSQVLAPLSSVDSMWADKRIMGGTGSGEGIIWNVRDPILKGDELVDEGVEDKRLLLVETEFAQVLAVIERQGATVSEILRRAWDGTTLQTLVKNNPTRATNAHIAMIGHITKSELVRRLPETEIANGLANRFIVCCARRSKLLPDGGALDWERLGSFTERIGRAVEFARNAGQMKRDHGAQTAWEKVYGPLSDPKPGLVGTLISRGEAQVLRLSMLYALLDCSAEIGKEHLAAALALWTYSEASCRYIFGDSLGDPTADEILRVLRAAHDGLSRTDIRDHFSRNKSEAEIARALKVLLEYRLARVLPTDGRKGRPPERWVASQDRYDIHDRNDQNPGVRSF